MFSDDLLPALEHGTKILVVCLIRVGDLVPKCQCDDSMFPKLTSKRFGEVLDGFPVILIESVRNYWGGGGRAPIFEHIRSLKNLTLS